MTRQGEDIADDLFRADAEKLGYLEPGGKGLYAYYRERGMVPPGDVKRIASRELTNWHLDIVMPSDRDHSKGRPPNDFPVGDFEQGAARRSAGATLLNRHRERSDK